MERGRRTGRVHLPLYHFVPAALHVTLPLRLADSAWSRRAGSRPSRPLLCSQQVARCLHQDDVRVTPADRVNDVQDSQLVV